MIWFFDMNSIHSAEIHHQLLEVCGKGVTNKGNLSNWCHLFPIKPRLDTHPSSPRIWKTGIMLMFIKTGVTLNELHEVIFHVSWPIFCKTVMVQIWYRKICVRWVPRIAHRWTQAEEVKETVMDWLNWLTTGFCGKRIIKLLQHLDKGPNCNGDYKKKKNKPIIVPSAC
jgi:hypothetical protein